MSRKQLAANQQNARKSTGPMTDEGKVASRMNALTRTAHREPREQIGKLVALAAAPDAPVLPHLFRP
jgi:hypothetical protein